MHIAQLGHNGLSLILYLNRNRSPFNEHKPNLTRVTILEQEPENQLYSQKNHPVG